MNNKFKNNEPVIINGFGKYNNAFYKGKIGIVICRDSYYLDYNIKFEDGIEDWLDEKYLESFKGE